jgi:U3 small nucleolar RNA-associated protein 11
MRNTVPRRPHKERSQPKAREKWGILEKHKDYSLRAADYNLKKKKLGQLSQKAKERNPDEFAFGMMSAEKGTAGKHGKGGNEALLSHDAVKLLKTQDSGYLRTVSNRGRREVQKLEEQVRLAEVMKEGGTAKIGKKIVFVDEDTSIPNKKRKRSFRGPETEVLQEVPQPMDADQALDMAISQPQASEVLNDENAPPPAHKSPAQLLRELTVTKRLLLERKRRRRLQELRANKLDALKKRQREILAAADELEAQRARMARTVGGVNKDGVKFKVRERKR